MKVRFVFTALTALLLPAFLPMSVYCAGKKSIRATNELAVALPFEGGGMLMYSRLYRLNRFLDAGFFAGGGQINRSFELSVSAPDDVKVETESFVFPFLGPQISINFKIIGLSLGYGVFWAKTDIKMNGPGAGRLTGAASGWGSGFYSPLLVLDFYNKKYDLVFGFGLGGFLGTSYETLTASSPNLEIQTNESPVQTLTFHMRMLWADGRQQRLERQKKLEDF